MTSTKSDIFKGIIEALTFENRKLIDMCEKSKGQKVNSVRVCGGGAVSDEWDSDFVQTFPAGILKE